MSNKPILCLDFDGVIHSYERGWQGGEIYGSATVGFFEWAKRAQEYFRLVVYSSRSKEPDRLHDMQEWLHVQYAAWLRSLVINPGNIPEIDLEFAHEKPPAFLTIDDRAIQFSGDWSDYDPALL